MKLLCKAVIAIGLGAILPGCQTGGINNRIPDSERIHIEASKLPAPPKDFSWKVFPDSEAAVVVPDSWKVFEEGKEGVLFSASKQVKTKSGYLRARMNFSVMEKVYEKSGGSPVKLLLQMGQNIVNNPNHKVELENAFPKFGLFHIRLRYVSQPIGMVPVKVHQYLVADERRDRIYMASFESPSAAWDEEWESGEKFMGNLIFPSYKR